MGFFDRLWDWVWPGDDDPESGPLSEPGRKVPGTGPGDFLNDGTTEIEDPVIDDFINR